MPAGSSATTAITPMLGVSTAQMSGLSRRKRRPNPGSTEPRRRYSLRDVNRRYASAALCLLLVSIWAPFGAHGRAMRPTARPTNPIVAENRLAGTDRWDIPWPGYRITDDRRLNIKGYATSTSVPQGGTIGLRITTAEHEPYTIDVYRLGYYDGLGGRHVTRLGPFDGSPQPACITMPKTGMITCPWTTSVELDVPTTWTSGVYFAVLTTVSKFQSEIMFTVLDDRSVRHRVRLVGQHVSGLQQLPVRPPGRRGLERGRVSAHRPQPLRLQQPDEQEVPGREARGEGVVRPALQLAVRQPGQRRAHRLRADDDRLPREARLRRHLCDGCRRGRRSRDAAARTRWC